jgi:hypothetical protein
MVGAKSVVDAVSIREQVQEITRAETRTALSTALGVKRQRVGGCL